MDSSGINRRRLSKISAGTLAGIMIVSHLVLGIYSIEFRQKSGL